MPIFTMRPSFTLSRISLLKRFFVPVRPFTTSWAFRMVKLDSCSEVMQIVRLMGTRILVYPLGTSASSACTKAKWSFLPTSTSRILAESRTLKPVAYFTSMVTRESPEVASPLCDFVLLPLQAQSNVEMTRKRVNFFISLSLFCFCLQKYKINS